MKNKITVLIIIVFSLILFSCNMAQKKITTYGKDNYVISSVDSDKVEYDYKNMTEQEAKDKLKDFAEGDTDTNISQNKNGSYTAEIKVGERTILHNFKIKNYFPSIKEILVYAAIVLVFILILLEQFKTSLPEALQNIISAIKGKFNKKK